MGEYEVSEVCKDCLESNTDFALIFDPNMNRNVWVCTRYKGEIYAKINVT